MPTCGAQPILLISVTRRGLHILIFPLSGAVAPLFRAPPASPATHRRCGGACSRCSSRYARSHRFFSGGGAVLSVVPSPVPSPVPRPAPARSGRAARKSSRAAMAGAGRGGSAPRLPGGSAPGRGGGTGHGLCGLCRAPTALGTRQGQGQGSCSTGAVACAAGAFRVGPSGRGSPAV